MCGIVGYIGKDDVKDILLNGLKRLEYRGYDSAGIAAISGNKLKLRRCKGKISELESMLKKDDFSSTIGVGHTRWATHGRPSEENAHPHTDCGKRLVVVHNGIVENYLILKRKLEKSGHIFKSETDTEVIAHLIERNLERQRKKSLLDAVERAIREIVGSFAIAAISLDDPERIVVARQHSPLIIGLGDGEFLAASDIPAVLNHTKRVLSLEDNDVADITRTGVSVYSNGRKKVKRKIAEISWDPILAEKDGYRHFMLKEIYEQPRVIQDTFRGRLDPDKGKAHLEEANLSDEDIKAFKKIFFVACGTAYHAGLVGKFIMEGVARIPCEVDIASEFRYRSPLVGREDLVVIISQSGETADTLAALREAKKRGAKTLVVCNVVGSSATREAGGVIYTHCGPEIGVASTKAFIAQLVILYIMSIHFGRVRGRVKAKEAGNLMIDLMRIPKLVEKILEKGTKDNGRPGEKYDVCVRRYHDRSDFLYLGRNINHPVALEGALKLKEISYIHAEGYPAGEMKHGPIALIDERMPVVVIATQSSVYEKILSNIEEVRARGGIVIALATRGDHHIGKKSDVVFELPKTTELLYPILNSIVLQLLAYHIANFRGCDIDQPRNLAKSVVVE